MAKATLEPTPNNEQIIYLTPDQITLDHVTDVRGGQRAKDEDERIENLAKSIFDQGQLQPILVRSNGTDGHYSLIAGRRRFAAIQRMKEIADSGKAPDMAAQLASRGPITVKAVVVDKNDDEAFAAAIQENLQRRDFSALEFALNIRAIRERYDWKDAAWSQKVAEFLRVSRATVTQHYKLLDLPKDIQQKVHKGLLSAQSAIDIHAVKESKREDVLAEAEQLAEAEAKEDAKKPKKASAKSAKPDLEAETGKIKRKHVLEAARKQDALTQVKPRTRNEIVGFFANVLESTDPYADPIVDLFQVIVKRWATGEVGDRAVYNKLNALNDLVADKPAAKKAVRKTA